MATKQMISGMKNLDKLAYHIICNWSKEINFNPVFDGIDYSQILRFYLWDKVGRAIRIQNNISFNEIESYKADYNSYPFYHTPLLPKGKYRRSLFSRKKVVFIPFQTSHTALLIQKLQASKKVKVISKQITKQLKKENVISALKYSYNEELGNTLFNAVIKAFDKFNIDLISEDKDLLKAQINGAVKITALAEKELLKHKPNAVYVHSDNHPPYINYILVAKKLNIPTFTYQHGLDCEQYLLDDCYADYVALWSENRKQRYIANSIFQPKEYKVLGNFILSVTELKQREIEKTILFITRPHKSIKCYSPFRNHLEGVNILRALLAFLDKNPKINLLIKAHPMDLVKPYEALISKSGLDTRVEIVNEPVESYFAKASVVVTEDSTAGVEAMLYNIPCIHAHFSKSEPVLPFVKSGVALAGYSHEELVNNLKKLFNLTQEKKEIIKINQQKFTQQLLPIGKVDSLVDFITQYS